MWRGKLEFFVLDIQTVFSTENLDLRYCDSSKIVVTDFSQIRPVPAARKTILNYVSHVIGTTFFCRSNL